MKKIKLNKKKTQAQMKIQEMAFVLVAVFFLFGLMLIFFTRMQADQYKQISDIVRNARIHGMLEYTASIPELRCSSSMIAYSEQSCIDYDKLKIMANTQRISEKYKDMFYVSNIQSVEISIILPEPESFTIYNSTKATNNTRTESINYPICEDSVERNCKLGMIKITGVFD